MIKPYRPYIAITAAILAAVPSGAAFAASGDRWDWSLAPYLWASSVSSDVSVAGQPVQSEVKFSDLIDKLDYGVLMHAEGQGDEFGMFADLVYMKVSDQTNGDVLSADAALTSTLFELALVWSPGEKRNVGFEGFAGLRYMENKVDVTFELAGPSVPSERRIVDPSATDFLIGARYTAELSERWSLTLRGDGSFGESDGSYGASAMLQYPTAGGAWAFGYRHLDYSSEALDQTLTGHRRLDTSSGSDAALMRFSG